MGAHIKDGQFQSDKYPTTPPGKVPLSVNDPSAQDLLWEYAQRRRAIDAEFSADLEACLIDAGFTRPPTESFINVRRLDARVMVPYEEDSPHGLDVPPPWKRYRYIRAEEARDAKLPERIYPLRLLVTVKGGGNMFHTHALELPWCVTGNGRGGIVLDRKRWMP